MDGVRKAYAWQEAISLSRELARICEEFSDADRNVLVWHLRQAVVDIPAGIATDLREKRSPQMEAVIKLATELELVHKIYPAIDTGEAPGKLAQLMERMASKKFNEQEPEPENDEDKASENAEAQPAGGTVIAPNVDQISGPAKSSKRRTVNVQQEDEIVTSIDPTQADQEK